jgi:tetratricopeptide (TPR) repeat protein
MLVGSPAEAAWLDRLERDHGNFRAALQWAIDRKEVATGIGLAAALYRMWYLRGYLGEGRRWLDELLAEYPGTPSVAWARALRGAGLLAFAAADYTAARLLTERGLELARALGDPHLINAALNNLGIILIDVGDYAAAQSLCEEGPAWRARTATRQWSPSFSTTWDTWPYIGATILRPSRHWRRA